MIFTPYISTFEKVNTDSLQAYTFNVFFETYVHNKIVSVSAPLVIICFRKDHYRFRNDDINDEILPFYSFPQYATTQFKGKKYVFLQMVLQILPTIR
jgi:hypothetical protein